MGTCDLNKDWYTLEEVNALTTIHCQGKNITAVSVSALASSADFYICAVHGLQKFYFLFLSQASVLILSFYILLSLCVLKMTNYWDINSLCHSGLEISIKITANS